MIFLVAKEPEKQVDLLVSELLGLATPGVICAQLVYISWDIFFFLCRSYNSFNEESSYSREETFASEQSRGSDDDQPNYEVQPNESLINYQSFMDKAPSTRWSKQDTELFYEV